MTWNRTCYPQFACEGPLGFPMTEEAARSLETLLKCQRSGSEWEYQRGFAGEAARALEEGERADVSVITSAAVDHDREVVLPSGVELDAFRKNPVVTFAHRYDLLPVGRALWIKQAGESIRAKTRYTARPADWQGDWLPDAVWHMVQCGDLRGKSIGFLPIEGHPPSADEIRVRPELGRVQWIYTRTLLLEYAVAPVQSNPEALVEAVAKGSVSAAVCQQLGLGGSGLWHEAGGLRTANVEVNSSRTIERADEFLRSHDHRDKAGGSLSFGLRSQVPSLAARSEIEARVRSACHEALGHFDPAALVADRLDRMRGRV